MLKVILFVGITLGSGHPRLMEKTMDNMPDCLTEMIAILESPEVNAQVRAKGGTFQAGCAFVAEPSDPT